MTDLLTLYGPAIGAIATAKAAQIALDIEARAEYRQPVRPDRR